MSRIDIYGFLGVGIGLMVGMVGHELAHAWTAVRLGDPTPRMMGRLTLNPKAHADPLGTVILPGIFLVSVLFRADLGFLFGYAKPVTIHPNRLRNPKRDHLIFAFAGPVFNLLVVIATGFAFRAVTGGTPLDRAFKAIDGGLPRMFLWIAIVNTFLFIINILPIPPLDGSRILGLFLSPSAAARLQGYSQYMFLFLIGLFLIFKNVLGNAAQAIYSPILGLP